MSLCGNQSTGSSFTWPWQTSCLAWWPSPRWLLCTGGRLWSVPLRPALLRCILCTPWGPSTRWYCSWCLWIASLPSGSLSDIPLWSPTERSTWPVACAGSVPSYAWWGLCSTLWPCPTATWTSSRSATAITYQWRSWHAATTSRTLKGWHLGIPWSPSWCLCPLSSFPTPLSSWPCWISLRTTGAIKSCPRAFRSSWSLVSIMCQGVLFTSLTHWASSWAMRTAPSSPWCTAWFPRCSIQSCTVWRQRTLKKRWWRNSQLLKYMFWNDLFVFVLITTHFWNLMWSDTRDKTCPFMSWQKCSLGFYNKHD